MRILALCRCGDYDTKYSRPGWRGKVESFAFLLIDSESKFFDLLVVEFVEFVSGIVPPDVCGPRGLLVLLFVSLDMSCYDAVSDFFPP